MLGFILLSLVIVVGIAKYFKKIAVGILQLYQLCCRQWLKIQGLTPADVAERRVVTGEAWNEYCDMLKAAGAAIVGVGTPKDPFSQAEGYRYLSRLARGGLEHFVEGSDPYAPTLTAIVDGYRVAPVKLGSDNPDNLYQNAALSGKLSYRVTGQRGTVSYLGFGTQAGSYGKPGGLTTVDYIEAKELEVSNSGEFELILSAERPQGCKNWLRTATDPDEGVFIIRQTFLDRATEIPAKLKLEVIGQASVPRPLTCERLDEGLKSAGLFVTGASIMFSKWANDFKKHSNKLPLFDQQRSNNAGGDPNIRYFHSYWQLDPDEALVIDAQPPECEHWNFQLNNHWMESLDYCNFPVVVNKHSAVYREDGSIRIIVADHNPNIPGTNWIDTTSHRCGTMCFRWISAKCTEEELPHPTTSVVKLSTMS